MKKHTLFILILNYHQWQRLVSIKDIVVYNKMVVELEWPLKNVCCCFLSPAHALKPSLILGAIFRPCLPLIWVVWNFHLRVVRLVAAVVVGWVQAVGGCGRPAGRSSNIWKRRKAGWGTETRATWILSEPILLLHCLRVHCLLYVFLKFFKSCRISFETQRLKFNVKWCILLDWEMVSYRVVETVERVDCCF